MIVMDAKNVLMPKADVDGLLEYSSTMPTGTTLGKRWKRMVYGGREYFDGSTLRIEPHWFMGEYTRYVNEKTVTVTWRELYVLENDEPPEHMRAAAAAIRAGADWVTVWELVPTMLVIPSAKDLIPRELIDVAASLRIESATQEELDRLTQTISTVRRIT